MSDNPWMQPAIPFPNQATVVDGEGDLKAYVVDDRIGD